MSHFIVGNGRRVKFWKDVWCSDMTLEKKKTLEDAFLALFSIAASKDEWVAEVWVDGEVVGWSPFFSMIENLIE